jgi:hypothetical protein
LKDQNLRPTISLRAPAARASVFNRSRFTSQSVLDTHDQQRDGANYNRNRHEHNQRADPKTNMLVEL